MLIPFTFGVDTRPVTLFSVYRWNRSPYYTIYIFYKRTKGLYNAEQWYRASIDRIVEVCVLQIDAEPEHNVVKIIDLVE